MAERGCIGGDADLAAAELARESPIAPLPCLSRRAYQRCEDCADEKTCRIRRVFAEVFYSYLVLIESLTLADVMHNDGVLPQLAAS